MDYWVYILKPKGHDVFYIGSTDNLKRRIEEHNLRPKKSSFTRRYKNWKVVYKERFSSQQQARQRERQLKRWKNKQRLVSLIGTQIQW